MEKKVNELQLLQQQKRALIIELMLHVLGKGNYQVRDMLRPPIVTAFLKLKELNIPNKGILMLLNYYGNPVAVVEQHLRERDQSQDGALLTPPQTRQLMQQ